MICKVRICVQPPTIAGLCTCAALCVWTFVLCTDVAGTCRAAPALHACMGCMHSRTWGKLDREQLLQAHA